MSRTLDTLKKMPSKEGVLHEHIARTYFRQKAQPKKTVPVEQIIRISILVLLAAAFLVFSAVAISLLNSHYLKFLKEKTAKARVISIFDKGRVNKEILRSFEFGGYAKIKSRVVDKTIVINNPRKYNWADMSFDFKFPIDFSDRSLSLVIKGKMGGETVSVVLRDSNNRSCRLRNLYLTSGWKTEEVSLNEAKKDIDLSQISHLRLECGQIGESAKFINSPIDVIIYIKEMRISKEG